MTTADLAGLGYGAVEHPTCWSDILAWNLALAGVLGAAALAGPRTPPAAPGERGPEPAASDGGPEVRAPQSSLVPRGRCIICKRRVPLTGGVVAPHRSRGSARVCLGTGSSPARGMP